MIQDTEIATRSGLRFTAWTAGPADGPLALFLHGFPQSRHTWREQLPALAAAGYRAVAPDQRGYSPGARPSPADLPNYRYDHLIEDVMALATACGCAADRRFHFIGHDWGGQVAWGVADRHPDRLASLAILSRPHPSAFHAALALADGDQAYRSRHHRAFLNPTTGPLLLKHNAQELRARLSDVPAEQVDHYLSVVGQPAPLEAALAWYRANPSLRASMGPIVTPTLYIWGDEDATVGRAAAEGTACYVTGPYGSVVLPGVGHFITDQSNPVTDRLLAHLQHHPA